MEVRAVFQVQSQLPSPKNSVGSGATFSDVMNQVRMNDRAKVEPRTERKVTGKHDTSPKGTSPKGDSEKMEEIRPQDAVKAEAKKTEMCDSPERVSLEEETDSVAESVPSQERVSESASEGELPVLPVMSPGLSQKAENLENLSMETERIDIQVTDVREQSQISEQVQRFSEEQPVETPIPAEGQAPKTESRLLQAYGRQTDEKADLDTVYHFVLDREISEKAETQTLSAVSEERGDGEKQDPLLKMNAVSEEDTADVSSGVILKSKTAEQSQEKPEFSSGKPEEALPSKTGPETKDSSKATFGKDLVFSAQPRESESIQHHEAMMRGAERPPVQQIREAIAVDVRVLSGGETLEVRLSPEHLGNVSMKLEMKAGEMIANIKVENPEVKAALEASLNSLRESLEQKGIQVKEIQVNVSKDGHRGGQEYTGKERGRREEDEEHQKEFTLDPVKE